MSLSKKGAEAVSLVGSELVLNPSLVLAGAYAGPTLRIDWLIRERRVRKRKASQARNAPKIAPKSPKRGERYTMLNEVLLELL